MLEPGLVFLFVCLFLLGPAILLYVADLAPWLFERNPPERQVLLEMLRELAKEEDLWERDGSEVYTHQDSGVSFQWRGIYHPDYVLTTVGSITFAYKSKGWRICQSVRDAVARREKRIRDLTALQNMTARFNKMNGEERG